MNRREKAVLTAWLDALDGLITGALSQEAFNARTSILWAHAEALGIEDKVLELARNIGSETAR
jgi:hypothetical protein